MTRRIIVGAIGGDRQQQAARALGRAVAQAGCILLTGGGERDADEVKNATRFGAEEVGRSGGTCRFVGVLPSETRQWITFGSSLLFYSGYPHNIRNFINSVTPDVLVVFGGSRGTLAEAAFAAAAGKPLLFYSGAAGGGVERLRDNFSRYFEDPQNEDDRDRYLNQPLAEFLTVCPNLLGPDALLSLSSDVLASAKDWQGTVDDLVRECTAAVAIADLQQPSGFPLLPNDLTAKERFESEICRISAA